ncbi:MAG: acetyl-CoA C-acyltransferase [Gammaproteobacteria bacterium]|nr:acetyl-CoA C-acyltransferase [Gammaproteobacteria bacterium]
MSSDSSKDPVVITAANRTPIGGFLGALQSQSATQLGAVAVADALQRCGDGLDGDAVDEVILGCVLPAGLGNAPARQAALRAGLPMSAGATTVNKMCGSGLKAAMLGFDAICAGSATVVIAGGMESMSGAPYLISGARGGLRFGHAKLSDHMLIDGLEDIHYDGRLMGDFAEDCAGKYAFSREQQDAFALESLARAKRAIAEGLFAEEIVTVEFAERRGNTVTVTEDEQPGLARPDKIPHLKPAFRKNGTVTPANSSSISDGAAALVLMRMSEAERRGCTPLARIVGHASHAQDPAWFTTAPIGAIGNLLQRIGWRAADVDLFEVNEAFAVVTMAAMKEFDLPHDKVNVHGGACALGHPVGASGARLMATLLAALKRYNGKRGVASLCIGGGEAVAMGVELV